MAVEAQNLKSHHPESMMNFHAGSAMDLADSLNRSGGGGSGGGRRKQSKPIRVFMDMMSAGVESETAPRPAEAHETLGMPELTEAVEKSPRHHMEMDVDDVFSCDLCNDTFITQSALTDHIQQSHDIADKHDKDIAYPTKYHQLGSELRQEVGLPTTNGADTPAKPENAAAAEPQPQPEPAVPTTPPNNGTDTNGRGSLSPDTYNNINSQGEVIRTGPDANRSRIFHPDAFCKMCDREFCNKYFLKTHMANKHGIFDSASSPSSGSPKLFGSNNGNDSNNHSMPPSGPSFAETLAMLPSVTGSGGFSAFGPPLPSESPKTSSVGPPPLLPPSMPSLSSISNNSQKHQHQQPPMISKQLQPPPPHTSVVTPTKTSSSSSLQSKPTPKEMEDYCEICQKHFCNKYYLKKHKQDVHGIIPEPNTGNLGKRGRPNMSSSTVSSNSCSPLTDVISTASAPMGGGHFPPGLDAMSGMPPGLGNVMFINPFASPFALLQNQPASVLQQAAAAAGFPPPGLPLPTPPSSGPHSQSPSSGPSPNMNASPGSLPPPPPPTSSSSSSSAADRSPLNPEAYCDLCRKEFCNIHFLKIHKANKHGVFYEDLPHIIQQASLSQLPVLNVPSVPISQSDSSNGGSGVIQIAPTAQEAGVKIKAEKPDTARGDERPYDYSPVKGEPCTVCKKEFNNKYSLQIHMINAHNMKPSDLDMVMGVGAGSLNDHMPKSEHLLQGTMFSNMIAAKLADRVMCDICNKEVCNKYFLKTHKLKVHGIDTASSHSGSERENESPPRSKGPAPLPPPPPSSVIKTPQGARPSSNESLPKPPTTPTKTEPQLPPRPNDEELLKMGIDPEAYCEICKKEFCSKYFLKTHRANIHGIKSSSGSQSPEKNDRPIYSSNHKPSYPTSPSFLHGFPSLDGKELPGFPGLPGLPVSLAQTLSSLSGGGGGHMSFPPLPSQGPGMLPGFPPENWSPENWPWKDQLNAQRVRCDICNKDLCNRYFLKTHMLNKHSLNYDPLTGTTTPLPQTSQPSDHGFSSNAADMMQPENLSMKPQPEDRKREVNEDSSSSDSKISAKTWHVPPTGGEKNSDQASNNNNNKENLPSSVKSEKSSERDYFIQKCQLCGMMFGEKVTLQLHMIQDHQGQVTVSTENQAAATAQLITFNLKKKYQRRSMKGRRLRRFGPSVGGAIGEKVRSAIVNHIASHQKNKKKFRCAHCQERFLSKPQCQAHIRQVHPNVRASTSSTTSSSADSKQHSAMDTSAPPAATPTPTPAVMQSFSLQEQDGRRVASSVVQLPVFGKIREPVSVTFTLTPM